jgi:Zn-dependent alcohol dehydrogenase
MGGDNKVIIEFHRQGKSCKVHLQGKAEYCAEINMFEKES